MPIALFSYNPAWSKQNLYDAAVLYMTTVLRLWSMSIPVLKGMAPPHGRKLGSGGTHFGLYLPSSEKHWSLDHPIETAPTIYVNVADSTAPVTKSNPRRYSYPGNKSDRTAAGILAHECGHHVYACLMQTQPHTIRLWHYCWKPKLKREPITGYEPIPEEGFAETMRLFALNPMLLKAGAPSRYIFLTKDCGLQPPHGVPWPRVLHGAAASVIVQATKWTEGKQKEKGLL